MYTLCSEPLEATLARASRPTLMARLGARIIAAAAMRYTADAVWEILARHRNAQRPKGWWR